MANKFNSSFFAEYINKKLSEESTREISIKSASAENYLAALESLFPEKLADKITDSKSVVFGTLSAPAKLAMMQERMKQAQKAMLSGNMEEATRLMQPLSDSGVVNVSVVKEYAKCSTLRKKQYLESFLDDDHKLTDKVKVDNFGGENFRNFLNYICEQIADGINLSKNSLTTIHPDKVDASNTLAVYFADYCTKKITAENNK